MVRWVQRSRAALGWTLWWLLPLLIALVLLAARASPSLDQYFIKTAQRAPCDSEAEWRAIGLPLFTWGKRCLRVIAHRQLGVDETYDQSLLISGVGRDARIWVNGNAVREFDRRSSFDSTSQPLLVVLQPGILHSGENEILFQLRSGDSQFDRIYLGSVLLAPSEALLDVYERAVTFGSNGAKLAIVLGVAILLTLLPMALMRRRDPSYRWYAIAVLCSVVYIWNMGWPLRPMPTSLWHLLAHLSLAGALWALLKHSIVIAGSSAHYRRSVDWMSLIAGSGMTLSAIANGASFSVAGDVVYRVALLLQLLMLAAFWWQRRGSAILLARWLAAGTVLNLILGLADSARVWRMAGGELAPYLLHWGILYLLLVLLVGQIKRILAALNTAEHAQQQLTLALEDRSQELQREFARRQQAEQARTLAEERQRIMRDMHDGVGGQLVALIGQAEHGTLDAAQLKAHLRRSLDDLRLMIDSLDDACADLGVALGMLRERLRPSLAGLPLDVRWQTAQLPDLAPRAPDEVLQVLRIVQEAITNALKHSHCRQLIIGANWADGWLEINVEDDGVGIGSTEPPGRGLPSMRQRAARIGGSIAIENSSPGTRVQLRLWQARDNAAEDGSNDAALPWVSAAPSPGSV